MIPSVSSPRYAVLTDRRLNLHDAKTAASLVRYRPEQVVALLDREHAGKTVQQVLGFGGDIPIVSELEQALAYQPNRLLIGIVPSDGALPSEWREMLLRALDHGLDLYSGMHTFLADDREIRERAARLGRAIVDLRAVPEDCAQSIGSRADVTVPVVLTVGSDCNIGKMTASLEIVRQAKAAGRNFAFVATGQTGLLIAERGLALDRVISDFVSRAVEKLLIESMDENPELILVEGQGSLLHPFYSAVTLGLLHGCRPDAMILCHGTARKEIRHCPGHRIPGYQRLMQIYQEAASWLQPAPVTGVALATYDLAEPEARAAIVAAGAESGLPVEDVVRFPDGSLLEVCNDLLAAREA